MVDPDEISQIPPESDLLEEKTVYDDGGYTVRYVPTPVAFCVDIETPGGSDRLSPGEAGLWAGEEAPNDAVAAAVEKAAAHCQFAALADVVGADTVRAYKDGDITAEELMDEFGRCVDRSVDRR